MLLRDPDAASSGPAVVAAAALPPSGQLRVSCRTCAARRSPQPAAVKRSGGSPVGPGPP